jgi:hypothetical protein
MHITEMAQVRGRCEPLPLIPRQKKQSVPQAMPGAAMSAIFLNKRLIFRIAYFAAGVVGTLVFLQMSGVQRLNGWIILASWLLLLAGFYFFGNRRTR